MMPYTVMKTTESKLTLITEHAKRDGDMQFTSLAHLLNVDLLRRIVVRYERDAQYIEQVLKERLRSFSLEVHPEKIRRFSFGRFERQNADKQGRRPNTFDFLGFKLGRETSLYQYYGVSGNYSGIARFRHCSTLLVRKWLNRQSQKKKMNWECFQ